MSDAAVEVSVDGERRAWGWLDSLRSGGTTSWREWTTPGEPPVRLGRFLPGAQQLELLRRLNLAGAPDPTLVERVVTASAPGRGRPDLQLSGAADPPRFGPRPVDPADLPDGELLRVATNLIAEDLVAAGTPRAPSVARPRPWRRSYRVAGMPWLAEPLRSELSRRGHPPGGRRPVVVVLGADVESMLVHAWTARCFSDGGPAWPAWLDAAVAHDRLPARADLVAMAGRWVERVGAHRVRVVIDHDQLPRVLGRAAAVPPAAMPSAAGVELARRVAAPLGLLVLPDRRAELLRRTLLPAVLDDAGPALALLPRHRAWARDRAERVHQALDAADYPVVGGLDRLRPQRRPGPRPGAAPDEHDVLTLALRLLLRPDAAPEEVSR